MDFKEMEGTDKEEMPLWQLLLKEILPCQPNLSTFTSVTSCVDRNTHAGNLETIVVEQYSSSMASQATEQVLPSLIILS